MAKAGDDGGIMRGTQSGERRFKLLAEGEMSEAQRKVYAEIASGPRGGVRGPFNALLRSPELADRAQRLGEWARFKSSLPEKLKEFAILVTARYWSAQYEWHAHRAHALKAGLAPRVADELALGKRPSGMSDDEAAVHDFCKELHENKALSDPTYEAVAKRFGERGAVDLIGVIGYYTLVSMILNVERHPLPDGATPLPALK
jgi:4-carboxymuconolactone decarboxylase